MLLYDAAAAVRLDDITLTTLPSELIHSNCDITNSTEHSVSFVELRARNIPRYLVLLQTQICFPVAAIAESESGEGRNDFCSPGSKLTVRDHPE
jgi:hypothetical protein